ncbi:MAG: HEAT repeat domain-containing protein [Planctomycetes bacterium]|nr:HEAT repeat domain-containing protein [Planctomycetota bacterium]
MNNLKYGLKPVAGLVFCLFCLTYGYAKVDDASWKEMEATFKKNITSKNAPDRILALNTIASADRKEAVVLIIDALGKACDKIQGLLRDKEKILESGKDKVIDSKISEKAAELIPQIEAEESVKSAAIETLKKVTDIEAISILLDSMVKTSNTNTKLALLEVAARKSSDPANEALLKLLNDSSDAIKISAATSLGENKYMPAVPKLIALLSEKTWQVKYTAAEALGFMGSLDAVGPLVDALQKESGRVKDEIVSALGLLTKNNFGDNPPLWKDWYEKNKADLQTAINRNDAPKNTPLVKEAKTTYYGLNVTAKRPIFLIDISMSMSFLITDSEAGKMPPGADGSALAANAKLNIAKQELMKVINSLADDVRFNIISYSDNVERWDKDLAPANSKMKKSAADYIDKLKLKGKTNIYDALEMAFNMAGVGAADKNYALGVDAIYFLTDGKPTLGQIQDTNKILEKVREWNKLSKIAIFTIALGQDTEEAFLKKLAEDNGGTFVSKKN